MMGPPGPGKVTGADRKLLVFRWGYCPIPGPVKRPWGTATCQQPALVSRWLMPREQRAGGAAPRRTGIPGSEGATGQQQHQLHPGLGEGSLGLLTPTLPCPVAPPDGWARAGCAWGGQGCHQAASQPRNSG